MSDAAQRHLPRLRVLGHHLAVCLLPHGAEAPEWAYRGEFHSITRTADELSIVCDFADVPEDVVHEGPWACIQVEGPLDFSLTGILAGISAPLAAAGVSIFALSTYHTDYMLVRSRDLPEAILALRYNGYRLV